MSYSDQNEGRIIRMPSLSMEQRMLEINSIIENRAFDDDRLVYSFVLHLYSNQEIDECIGFVTAKLNAVKDEYRLYYHLWYISLLYLRGFFDDAKTIFYSLPINDIPNNIKTFYLITLGFDALYRDFFVMETAHFVFHIHPNRYRNQNNIHHKVTRRELGYEIVAKNFFGLSLERKIHYFLWDDESMKPYFSNSQTCSCYGVIQEGEYDRDWHESTHVYNYLYGIENPKSFILEGLAVLYDGKTSIVRLRYARAAYQGLRITPHIKEWWLDPVAFRQTNSWIAYTTAGYFLFKLRSLYGKEKLLQLAKYQTFEDACRIYGEAEISKLISEVEEEISNLGTGNP